MKITHIITSVNVGGAEKVMLRLLKDMNSDRFEHEIISLAKRGVLADAFEAIGVPVTSLDFRNDRLNVMALARLRRVLIEQKPDIVQTWLYHGDFIGGLSARLWTKAPVVWNLRQSNLDERASSKFTRMLMRGCAKLSRIVPRVIVCGSDAARKVHAAAGYDADRMVTIANGYDTEHFAPSAEKRAQFRSSLGVGDDAILIGHAARFDPQKDHRTFLAAAERVIAAVPQAIFVLSGADIDEHNADLMALIGRGLVAEGRVRLLGACVDMPGFYAAMDTVVSSSAFGEGGPNVVGEAMACGVSCIATDVGDSAQFIGDTGRVVPVRNAVALADAIIALAAKTVEERRALGQAARARIVQRYPLAGMVKAYEDLYLAITSAKPAPDR